MRPSPAISLLVSANVSSPDHHSAYGTSPIANEQSTGFPPIDGKLLQTPATLELGCSLYGDSLDMLFMSRRAH